jgi:hypothetical protein
MSSYFTTEQSSVPRRGLSLQQQTPIIKDSTDEEKKKRRDRYFVLAGPWIHQTNPREFLGWEIRGNEITKAQYYKSETVTDHTGKLMSETFRYPGDILDDLRLNNKHLVELPALAEFDSATAAKVVEVLSMQTRCEKYAAQNQFVCTYCWSKYLEGDIAARIENELETAEIKDAAYASARLISDELAKVADTLLFQEDESLRDVEDPKTAKTKLNAFDLMVIRHQHHDLPEFKTSVNRASEANNLIRELVSHLRPQPAEVPQVNDADSLRKLIFDAQQQLDAIEKPAPLTDTQESAKVQSELTAAERMEKVRAAKKIGREID